MPLWQREKVQELPWTYIKSNDGENKRFWKVYVCSRCGGAVTAAAEKVNGYIQKRSIHPGITGVDEEIPNPAREYLRQALNSRHSPAGSVMLCASAVDAMLKAKSYKNGSLFTRTSQAAKDHLITAEMAEWAHQVRLDANDQRHADEKVLLPDEKDAGRCIEFALVLGEFMFVLPSRIQRGIAESKRQEEANEKPSMDDPIA